MLLSVSLALRLLALSPVMPRLAPNTNSLRRRLAQHEARVGRTDHELSAVVREADGEQRAVYMPPLLQEVLEHATVPADAENAVLLLRVEELVLGRMTT